MRRRSESVDPVPSPVLFNPWKYHAGALRRRIAEIAAAGPPALAELPQQLVVIGTGLMDLYPGYQPPTDIAQAILELLQAEGHLDAVAYRDLLEANRGYRVLSLPADGSAWVLRPGEKGGRHVHIHPGRWTPNTRRVRANVLKTAVMALAYAGAHGGTPLDVGLINHVRDRNLGLPPLRALADQEGLSAVLEALRAER